MKKLVRWCVMVGEEMFPDSLSRSRDGAWSYLGDAENAAVGHVKVYVAKVTIEPEKVEAKR